MAVTDKETKAVSQREVTIDADTCNRRGTTYEALAKLEPVMGAGKFVTAGNASQLVRRRFGLRADGSRRGRARRACRPLGAFRGLAVAGCEPDEMGIGPVFAVPKLLARHGLTVDDIGLWELNEAFASQAIYCQQKLEHSRRPPQRRRRRHLHRPPLRHDRRAPCGPRADRGPPPRRRSTRW